jgi:hypothetical protein
MQVIKNRSERKIEANKPYISQIDLKRLKKLEELENVINRDSNEIIILKVKLSKSKQLLETILSKVEKK